MKLSYANSCTQEKIVSSWVSAFPMLYLNLIIFNFHINSINPLEMYYILEGNGCMHITDQKEIIQLASLFTFLKYSAVD